MQKQLRDLVVLTELRDGEYEELLAAALRGVPVVRPFGVVRMYRTPSTRASARAPPSAVARDGEDFDDHGKDSYDDDDDDDDDDDGDWS